MLRFHPYTARRTSDPFLALSAERSSSCWFSSLELIGSLLLISIVQMVDRQLQSIIRRSVSTLQFSFPHRRRQDVLSKQKIYPGETKGEGRATLYPVGERRKSESHGDKRRKHSTILISPYAP